MVSLPSALAPIVVTKLTILKFKMEDFAVSVSVSGLILLKEKHSQELISKELEPNAQNVSIEKSFLIGIGKREQYPAWVCNNCEYAIVIKE
jgi:hypothetical protein